MIECDTFHQRKKRLWNDPDKQAALKTTNRLIATLLGDIKYEAPFTNKHGQPFDLKYELERVEYIYQLILKI